MAKAVEVENGDGGAVGDVDGDVVVVVGGDDDDYC